MEDFLKSSDSESNDIPNGTPPSEDDSSNESFSPPVKKAKKVTFAEGTKKGDTTTSLGQNLSVLPNIQASKELYPFDFDKNTKPEILKIGDKSQKQVLYNKKMEIEAKEINSMDQNKALAMLDYRFKKDDKNYFYYSETSDEEKDFGKLTQKYKVFNRLYEHGLEEIEHKAKVIKERHNKLDHAKQAIANLREERDELLKEEGCEVKKKLMDDKDEYTVWKQRMKKKGVIYISSLPFGCTLEQLRNIFNEFGVVTNVHLEAKREESKLYGKWRHFSEAWVEFKDKKTAKMVPRLINGTKIPKRYVNNRLAASYVWQLRYLKGFRWRHLVEYKETIRVLQRKKHELAIAEAHRQTSFFKDQVQHAKQISRACFTKGDQQEEKEENEFLGDDEGEEEEREVEPPFKKRKLVEQKKLSVRRIWKNVLKRRVKSIWRKE